MYGMSGVQAATVRPRLSLKDAIPAGYELRNTQTDILRLFETAIEKGYRDIVICAPTGVGKSLVAMTISNLMDGSHVITASKALQDQYMRDFASINAMSIKGKSNFACLDLMEQHHFPAQGLYESDKKAYDNDKAVFAQAIRAGYDCSKGVCKKEALPGLVGADGSSAAAGSSRTCIHKPSSIDAAIRGDCLYYYQKYAALRDAKHIIWNYASFLTAMRYGRRQADFQYHMERRPLLIFDEAHAMEDNITNFAGYDITASTLRECGILEWVSDITDSDIVQDISGIMEHLVSTLKEAVTNAADEAAYGRLSKKTEAAQQVSYDMRDPHYGYVANTPIRDRDDKIKTIEIRPVNIAPFASEILGIGGFDEGGGKYDPVRIYMSATISKRGVCDSLGLSMADTAGIDVTRHPFTAEARHIQYDDTAYIKYGCPPESEALIHSRIESILNEHAGHRGLILTSSRSRCFAIKDALSTKNRRRLRIAHSTGNFQDMTLKDILKEHADTPNSVLCSSSLWEGIDLAGDLSRFCIMAKCPYPNYTDNFTRQKMRLKKGWYRSKTVLKVLQGMGRSVRNYEDHAKTYVLDAAITALLRQSAALVPAAMCDVMPKAA